MQTPCPQPEWPTPAFSRHVGESAVAIVAEKMRCGFAASGKALEAPAVHDENVEPAVVVVIVECDAAAGSFEQIFLFLCTPPKMVLTFSPDSRATALCGEPTPRSED